ncbi:hypothetical protein QJS10_CPA16g00693 [Acorus calamus]|uniref:Nucleolus and neural progenitor protein-like N-terminal domain-containing protein n=1 Tax=Acorus calamus TaxID=4465 RepID=A0AAV9D340_ACOCL|nr:hypothetical protein QJS10_CPA16g00693 [Acorus calamus]
MSGSECTNLEERLGSLLGLLRTESGILDRIVYKGKNQHRRCPYFQYLLKVQRDVKLLRSSGVEETLSFLFQVISEKKPTEMVAFFERLKKKNTEGKHNSQLRLLGIARLLSQVGEDMVEPILKAAIQISYLLARSFFMGFSLTVLAILARLRVLVQQVFREYHPPSGQYLMLECVWDKDKFVLLEKTSKSSTESRDKEDIGEVVLPLETPPIQYETIEISNEGDERMPKDVNKDSYVEDILSPAEDNHISNMPSDDSIKIIKNQALKGCEDRKVMLSKRSPKPVSATVGSPTEALAPLQTPRSISRPAFLAVRKSAPAGKSKDAPSKKAKVSHLSGVAGENEDPFFSMLTAGTKESLF